MPTACRRALLVTPLLLVVAFFCGCRPRVEQRPWTLAFQYDDTGQRLPTIIPQTGPIFHQSLQPEGAAPSPTGTHLLMATQEGGLWLHDVLKGGASVRLAEQGVAAQFWPDVSPWAPDGRAVVYATAGDLVYQRLGGGPQKLTSTGDVFTAAISPDGAQVAFGRRGPQDEDRGLWAVPVAGSEPKQLVPPTGDIFHACCPHWSPDGRWIAFLQAFEGGALGVVSADGNDLRAGLDAAWEPVRWLPDSDTVLFSKVVYGEPGDGIHRYSVSDKQVTLVTGSDRHATMALSPDATKALVASWQEASDGQVSEAKAEIVAVATGAVEGQALKLPGAARQVLWAPDGKQLALLVDDAQGKSTVLRSPEGLAQLQPAAHDASALSGWVREWQPQRPWWRFWG